MRLKARVKKIEGRSGMKRGIEMSVIYLCELQSKDEETVDGGEPRVAYIEKGPKAGSQLSRHADETRDEFKARADRVVEGLE